MEAPGCWRDLTGALLANGRYERRRNDRDLQFGSPTNRDPWRTLLTGAARSNMQPTADALAQVLDAVAAGGPPREALRRIQDEFVRARQLACDLDWRYYMVRYAAMRQGPSGIYASVGGDMGYLVCMLDKTQMNGRYRDPYLTALAHQVGGAGLAEGPGGPVFTGGSVESQRWLDLARSGAAVRCVRDGWVLRRPVREEFVERFDEVCTKFHVDKSLKLVVPQQTRAARRVDSSDRIEAAALLVTALVDAGL